MEYTEDQLSKKFPMNQLPWMDGLYEVTHKDGDVFYSYFIKGAWRSGNRYIKDASKQSPLISDSVIRDRESWRGISFDPSKPKKRANKRKTVYVVYGKCRITENSGVVAAFNTKPEADSFVAYRDKLDSDIKHTTKPLRFRVK